VITPEQLARPNDETSQQIALMCWAGLNQNLYPQLKWLHAIPNANSHRIVAEGVRAGVSDVFLPFATVNETIPSDGYFGLYIEMKIEKRRNQKNGGLSQDQIDFIDYARKAGYKCCVCYSWIEAKNAILEYLGG
jgi:VRR-NUC domain